MSGSIRPLQANSDIEAGNKEYESFYINTFGPNWPVPVDIDDYEAFIDFQSDYVLQLGGGVSLLDGLSDMLINSKNEIYSTMISDRNEAKSELEFVKKISLWIYALGTLLAILSKVGEFYREQNSLYSHMTNKDRLHPAAILPVNKRTGVE